MLDRQQLPSARRNALICETVSDECVIYDQLNKKVHHLNDSLAWIWRKCDGKTTVDSIAAALEQEFGAGDALQAVFTGLKQLQDCELLDTPIDTPQLAAEATQVSRRAVVAGGSVVVPAVVSMLAPTPADAKSKDKDKDKNASKVKR